MKYALFSGTGKQGGIWVHFGLVEVNGNDGDDQDGDEKEYSQPKCPSLQDCFLGTALILAELGVVGSTGDCRSHILVLLLILHEAE